MTHGRRPGADHGHRSGLSRGVPRGAEPPRPWWSGTSATADSRGSERAVADRRSNAAVRRASSGLRDCGAAAVTCSSSARRRRTTCGLDEPYSSVSSRARETKSAQPGAGYDTRGVPLPSSSQASPRERRDSRRSASSIWSRACTAVVGSFTAGESALIAMSASSRNPYAASCSTVRLGPYRTQAATRAARRTSTLPPPPTGSTNAIVAPAPAKSPIARTKRIRRPWRAASRTSLGSSTESRTAGPPPWTTGTRAPRWVSSAVGGTGTAGPGGYVWSMTVRSRSATPRERPPPVTACRREARRRSTTTESTSTSPTARVTLPRGTRSFCTWLRATSAYRAVPISSPKSTRYRLKCPSAETSRGDIDWTVWITSVIAVTMKPASVIMPPAMAASVACAVDASNPSPVDGRCCSQRGTAHPRKAPSTTSRTAAPRLRTLRARLEPLLRRGARARAGGVIVGRAGSARGRAGMRRCSYLS